MGIRERVIRLLGGSADATSASAGGDDYAIMDGMGAGWGSLHEAQAFRLEFDQPYARVSAEKLGFHAFQLKEWSEEERKEIITRCHQAWERNPIAYTAVAYTRMFTVGKGMTVSYRSREAQEAIEGFLEEHKVEESGLEGQFCDALQLDGEIFLRFFTAAGKTAMVVVRPWDVHWIKTEKGNRLKRVSYNLTEIEGTGEMGGEETPGQTVDVPADEVLHFPINKLPYEMRGRPELFRVLPWLRAYRDWLEERARLNRRKSLYWDVTLKSATAAQVTAKRNQYKEPPPPGSIVVHNENEEWKSLSSNIQAGEAAEDGRQIKLMAAAGMQIPEFYLSDGANANLASATAQGFPVLRKFAAYQELLVNMWKGVLRKVLEAQMKAGLLAEEYPEVDADGDPIEDEDGQPRTVKLLDSFDVRYPELEERDPKTLAEALQLHVSNAWCANETAAAKAGYDPRVENKKMERERAEQERAAAQREPVPGEEPSGAEPGGEQGGQPPVGGQPPQRREQGARPSTVGPEESDQEIAERRPGAEK